MIARHQFADEDKVFVIEEESSPLDIVLAQTTIDLTFVESMNVELPNFEED
jgi:hypothetical protein